MSTRAYRINKIESEPTQSFNLTHQGEMLDWLQANDESYTEQIGEGGGGTMEFSVAALEDLVELVKKGSSELVHMGYGDRPATPYTLEEMEGIVRDIAWAKAKGDEWVMYHCG